MANDPRTSHASYIVLGVVALRGPTTSYQLKQYVSESISYFWPLQHASLYREPKRLETLGLLSSKIEPSGRRRQFFEITSKGLSELLNWIKGPGSQTLELRDEALLKLHFGQLVEPADIRTLAESQLAERQSRLAFFTELQQRYQSGPDQEHTLQTLKAGQAFERAFIAFWREIASHADGLVTAPSIPPAPGKRSRRATRTTRKSHA